MRLPDVDHGGQSMAGKAWRAKHGGAWGQDLSLGQTTTQIEIYAKTETRYALLRLALRYRWLSSPWAWVGDSTWASVVRSGPSRPAERAPVIVRHRDHETQGWDVPCAVAIDSAGQDLRGLQLRGLQHENIATWRFLIRAPAGGGSGHCGASWLLRLTTP